MVLIKVLSHSHLPIPVVPYLFLPTPTLSPSFCPSPSHKCVVLQTLHEQNLPRSPVEDGGTRTQERTSQEWLGHEGILWPALGTIPIFCLNTESWEHSGPPSGFRQVVFLSDEWGHMCSDSTWHVSGSLFTQASNEGKGLFWLFPLLRRVGWGHSREIAARSHYP